MSFISRNKYIGERKMDFYDWLIIQKDLSKSAASKYKNAVYGVISEWAGIPLANINNYADFEQIRSAIIVLPIFIERNNIGHNMYSCALDKYGEYIKCGFGNKK
jgi:hypothetical protein